MPAPAPLPAPVSVVVVGGPARAALAEELGAAGVTQIIEADADAGALDGALDAVSEELVLFVDAAALPEPGAFRAAVDRLRPDGGLSALALAPTRRVSVFGLPLGEPVAAPPETEVLYAPLGAMLCRTGHLRAIGGFGAGSAALGAGGAALDVDLGWRLWLAGGAVRAFPAAVEVPTVGSPADADADADADAVAAALAQVATCFDDERRAVIVPAAAAALGALAGPDGGAAGVGRFEERAVALRAQRAGVQAGRRRRDAELLGLFLGPGASLAALGPAAAGAVAASGAGDALEHLFGASRRILVVTADVLTPRMAGPAIRAWQIAAALAEHHDVHLATLSNICELQAATFAVEAAAEARIAELEAWCDVVILQGYALQSSPSLRATTKVMVVDIYDPLHFETLELTRRDDAGGRRAHVGNAVDTLNEQMGRGDFFVCASPKQRDLYIGHLSALGRINPVSYDVDSTLRALIDVVPFGLPDVPARHERPAIKGVFPGIGAGDEVILWGGGIYNWFDPITLIRAVDALRHRRPQVRLFFLGVRHPNPGVNPMLRTAAEARVLSDRLGLTNTHVYFNDSWVGYDERQNYLTEADLGVSTHHDHAETAYSFRTRILDYLWAGLPIVSTAGDGFAELIDAEGLGLTVPADDAAALEEALFTLLDDAGLRARCRAEVERVRPGFAWSKTLRPLVAFCAQPRRAADLVGIERALATPGPAHAPAPPVVPSPWAERARIAAYLYREGGVRRVAQGALTRAARRARSRTLG